MATTQSNLGKVHVFPSETLYNNNKTSVAANDLAFVVDNSSGIVAQSLGANGYVKFANGLIIQWGISTSNPNTFPIAFSSTNWRMASASISDGHSENFAFGSKTTTGFTQVHGYVDEYIVIGF